MFSGKLLSRLNYGRKRLPIQTIQDIGMVVRRHRMDETLASEWRTLECYLERIITVLRYTVKHFPLGLDLEEYHPPSYYQYSKSYHTPGEVQTAAMRAKMAFTIRLAYISCLACLATAQDGSTHWRPTWVAKALEKGYITEAIWEDLASTWVFRQEVPRMGGFVDIMLGSGANIEEHYRSTQWFPYINVISRNMPYLPLWLEYSSPHISSAPELAIARKFCPTNQQACNAIAESTLAESSGTRRSPTRKGKDFFQYRRDMLAWLAEWRTQASTIEQTEADKVVEEHRHACPAGRSVRIWFWEVRTRKDGSQQWSQEFLARSDKLTWIWDRTIPEGRIYNPMLREWDVYDGVEPSTEPMSVNLFPADYDQDKQEEAVDVEAVDVEPMEDVVSCDQSGALPAGTSGTDMHTDLGTSMTEVEVSYC